MFYKSVKESPVFDSAGCLTVVCGPVGRLVAPDRVLIINQTKRMFPHTATKGYNHAFNQSDI